jgi:hypothetical protein
MDTHSAWMDVQTSTKYSFEILIMKKRHLLSLIFFSILLSQSSCIIDCVENGGYIQLELIKDGHNALYGPDAIINRDSIRLSDINGFDEIISYDDSTKTIEMFIFDTKEYILKIGNNSSDTIIGNTVVTSTGRGGCSSYQLAKVTINGQVVCHDGCEEIIEVQL